MTGSVESTEFLFRRENVSRHNTSAPDIWIGGFDFERRSAEFIRGDTDGNGSIDLSDPVSLLGLLFLGREGAGCADAADADDSGALDLADAVYVLQFLFRGGRPPLPASECGPDPSEDSLDCRDDPPSCTDR